MSKDIFVDFDGTICPNKGNMDTLPAPSEKCIKILHALRNAGHKIIIYSVRSNKCETKRDFGHSEMIDYLIENHVPFDGVDCSKVHFSMLIDDKCLGSPITKEKNVDWDKVGILLSEKLNLTF